MANRIKSGTTTGGAVTQVTFASWYGGLEVVNRGTSDMWARFDGVDPTIAGDDCHYIPPQSFMAINNPKLPPDVEGRTSNCDIRLITSSACDYTVSVGV